ncbi:alpha/beta-type small acid-soluble spore protein [Dehalobacter sp. DCM]|uniref:alpha/beta-type small acid-soluble spore protein n=1 Tax=Dehalobacter sp. DCM TaxID=2907827 RepID=UPI0030812CB7|nr:alpha/beta-type small acid-soluble spore protein [Dehalobacter sp. DCM]
MPQMNPQDYAKYLMESKVQIAQELGITFDIDGDNGHLSSRDAGRIGGRLGGKIGGNMVKRMVAYSEEHLARNGHL